MNDTKVFIFTCTGKIVGNPKGYSNFKYAERTANSKHTKAYKTIWMEFYNHKAQYPDHRLIYRIGSTFNCD